MVWLLTLIRGIFMALYVGVSTAIFSTTTILFGLFGHGYFGFYLCKWVWAGPIMRLAGIQIEYREDPGLPDKGFLYLFNHTSFNDIIAMVAALPKPPMFGAKAELFKIPFFGPAMRAVGILPIHRDQREKVLQLYKEAKTRVENGESFALAPEGTRRDGDELGRFKKGPFIFAVNSEMPIVPLVIAGARQTQPKGSYLMNVGRWKRKMIIHALAPINAADYTEETMGGLQEAVKAKMEVAYQNAKEELGIVEGSSEYRPSTK